MKLQNIKTSSRIRNVLIELGLALILASCIAEPEQFPDGAVSNFENLLTEFENPPGKYGSAPLYSWNDKITKEGIASNMEELKNAGFGGVFIHPRPGLVTEYLSDEWFDLYKFTVQKGKELDMHVSIYDENSYPSGFAGGHVSVEMPEAENNGQGLTPNSANEIPDDYKKYYLILKKEGDKYIDITSKAGSEKGLGEYMFYEKTYYSNTWGGSAWYGRGKNNKSSYVDLLMPGVTEKFIEISFDGYEKTVGEEFGKTVTHIFTDEPTINTPGGIRWTTDLFEVFEKQWKYDLKVNLPSLSEKIGDWKKVRHNYTKTLLWLFVERWAKPNYNYCEGKDLIYTGHYWEHVWPVMNHGPDNMAMAAYQQMPGVDMLFNQFNEVSTTAQFGNVRSVKEVASVSNQLGRNRTLSESHAGSGSDLTFESMKMLGDWQYALGINFLNQFSYYSLAGSRKYDYPLSFDYHAPWWAEYKYLNEYYKRLSLVLSSGKQKNDILIIEPTSTAWMYDSYVKKDKEGPRPKIGLPFQSFVTNLEKNQVEYDLGSEDIINNHGSVEDKQLVVGERKYSKVVLPATMENLNESTFKLIKEFVNNGGELITFSKPTRIDGAESADISSVFNGKSVKYFKELNKSVIADNFSSEDFKLISLKGGNLFHNRRLMNDGQILFLTNASLKESTSGEIRIKGKDAILLDAFTGKIEDYKELNEKGFINISFSLSPAESLLLFISNKKHDEYKLPQNNVGVTLQAESSIKTVRSEDNVLVLDFCDLKVADKNRHTDLHVGVALHKAYKDNGCSSSNPWGSAIQYKTNTLDKAKEFNKNSGFTATYNFTIDDTFDYSEFTAIVERPEIWEVFINGTLAKPIKGAWKIDKSFGVYPIGKNVVKGKNSIEIRCYPMSIFAEIAPIYLLGDFSLEAEKKGWKIKSPITILKPGSWKAQGHPFYPWGMKYKKQYQVNDNLKKFIVKAGEWKGSVASVSVNGEKAGTILLQTGKLDVSHFIKKGKNEIVFEVIGSFKNLTGPFHNNPPKGFTSPGNWKNVRNYPSGYEFDLFDYGLMDNFNLLIAD